MNRLRFFKKHPVNIWSGGFGDDDIDLTQEDEEMDLRDLITNSRDKAFYKSYDDARSKSKDPNVISQTVAATFLAGVVAAAPRLLLLALLLILLLRSDLLHSRFL